MSVLVFSKDRPLQLDAALRSLKLDCDALDPASVRVLYRTSTPFFASQYRVLANQHANLAFVREQGFKADLMRLVDGSRYVFFVVDDTLFVRQFSVAQAIRALESEPGCLGVSLRLGSRPRPWHPATHGIRTVCADALAVRARASRYSVCRPGDLPN